MLFQIETDKVTVDVRAPEEGTIESILVGHQSCMLDCSCQSLENPVVPCTRHTSRKISASCCQVKEDDVVKVGQLLAKITAGAAAEAPAPAKDDGGADLADTGPHAAVEESKSTGMLDICMP